MNALIIFAGQDLIYVLAIAVVVVGYIIGIKRGSQAAKLWFLRFSCAIFVATIVILILQIMFPLQRPYVSLGTHALFPAPADNSFPSSHATYGAVIASFIFWYKKSYGVLAFLILILIVIGRELALVHYPVDLIVGTIIGIVITFLCFRLPLRKLVR